MIKKGLVGIHANNCTRADAQSNYTLALIELH